MFYERVDPYCVCVCLKMGYWRKTPQILDTKDMLIQESINIIFLTSKSNSGPPDNIQNMAPKQNTIIIIQVSYCYFIKAKI